MSKEFDPLAELETTNEQIEFDHKLMLNLCNKLKKSLEQDINKQNCIATIDVLLRFARKHSQYEESIREAYQYKFTEEHQEDHLRFLEDLEHIRKDIETGDETAIDTFAVLYRKYITQHVETITKLLHGN